MKNALLSLVIMLFVTACSPKSERAESGTPQFPIAVDDIMSASAESAVVHIEFSKAKAEAFRQFTKEHLGQKIQVVVGTNVVAEPMVRSEISGGKIVVSCSSSENAQALAAKLSQK
jgi:preprotein translocase subunit SecD